MESFLQSSKKALISQGHYSNFKVVLGNYACDLDSVVSALVYSFYLWKTSETKTDGTTAFIPLLNIARQELRLRTEVVYFLKKVGLFEDVLHFREDVDLQMLFKRGKLSLILVDHNTLKGSDEEFTSSIIEIIDHHTLGSFVSERTSLSLEMVGSCCTLIAEVCLNNEAFPIDHQTALLLYGTILLDTVRLDDKAGRTTTKDKQVAVQLQKLLPNVNDLELFNALQLAKCDIKGLTVAELLIKDMKEVYNSELTILISSVPILVEELLKKYSALDSLKTFSTSHKAQAVVIMGISVNEANQGRVRQIGIYSMNDVLKKKIITILEDSSPSLKMTLLFSNSLVSVFNQGDIKASRKVILPLINKFVQDENTSFTEFVLDNNSERTKVTSTSSVSVLHAETVAEDILVASVDNEGYLMASQMLGVGDPLSTVASSQNSSNQNSCPYTPLNSCAEGELDLDPYSTNILPSFNSREMLEKINKKRNKLREYDGDSFDTYPFTPKNSYVETNFDTFARSLPHFDAQTLYRKVEENKAVLEQITVAEKVPQSSSSNLSEIQNSVVSSSNETVPRIIFLDSALDDQKVNNILDSVNSDVSINQGRNVENNIISTEFPDPETTNKPFKG